MAVLELTSLTCSIYLSAPSDTTVTEIHLFPIERLPLQELIQTTTSEGKDPDARDPSKAAHAKLWLGIEIGKGAFKTARIGQLQLIDPKEFSGEGLPDNILGFRDVAVKVVNSKGKKKKVPNAQASLRHLTMERRTHQWATALLDHTLCYVDEVIAQHGTPEFPIPSVRFVQAGVAMPVSTDTAYFIEELIKPTKPFIKYINNATSRCVNLSDPEEVARGLFLSFAQHHQWLSTDKLAFVSDFQGNYLTPPSRL